MKYTQAIIKNQKNGLLRKIPNTNYWEVAEDFVWIIDRNYKTSEKIIIEKGFKTNFGSIPRVFWNIFNKTKYISYILHDGLLNEKVNGENQTKVNTEGKKYDRYEADFILFKALKVEGAGLLERLCVYGAISLWSVFKNIFIF